MRKSSSAGDTEWDFEQSLWDVYEIVAVSKRSETGLVLDKLESVARVCQRIIAGTFSAFAACTISSSGTSSLPSSNVAAAIPVDSVVSETPIQRKGAGDSAGELRESKPWIEVLQLICAQEHGSFKRRLSAQGLVQFWALKRCKLERLTKCK
ncbi:hypothetical protein ACFX15_008955 [Malus domestica]